jgi:GH25 family lysozyme M1 (1,4-beta-N-acetylmuramidase)
VDFAIIRLGYRGYTQGAIQTDSCFYQNIQGALDAGLDVGVYFFSQAITPEEARQEADYVLSLLESYPITCPVVYDWEPITFAEGARTDQLENEVLTQCAAAFCQQIAQAGYTPAVYFNQEMGYFSFDLKELSPFQFWLAEYDSYPSFYYGFTMWQYTHEGRVDGIQTPVDWNLDFSGLKR